MKIVFIGLASTYTPGMTYQDNYLCQVAVADGHQVTYISNPEKYVNGKVVPTGFEDEILPDGMHLIRPPYCKLGPSVITRKIRKFKGIYHILEQAQPNVIFCHNTQYWSILDVIRYKKNHPSVRLYADSHTDANNSGTNWLSLHLLHRVFYRYLVQKAIPYLEKYLVLGEETRVFNRDQYGVPESLMEFYPLGGILPTPEEYAARRTRRRAELGVGEDELLFIHSGKLDALKRTEELLKAFSAVPGQRLHLAIIGSIPEDRKSTLIALMEKDTRVQFLGWQNADELMEYLCACDVYCQPGSQSATMQNAVCANCAIMLYPHSAYVNDFDYGNIIWVQTQTDMEQAFLAIESGEIRIERLQEKSGQCAKELLDYRQLAARLYR